jgi:hypothetical protein
MLYALSLLWQYLVAVKILICLRGTKLFPEIKKKERLLANVIACKHCDYACCEFAFGVREDFRRESTIKYPQL